MIHCFPAIEASDAEILILGSIPSVRSLCKNQYYGHPRNAFWTIMGAIFDFDSELDYEARIAILLNNKIALWDVAKSCEREGSLDSAIKTSSVTANDFETFFREHPRISRVLFNGTKAESEFNRLVLKKKGKEKTNNKEKKKNKANIEHSTLNIQHRIENKNEEKHTKRIRSSIFDELRFSRLPSTSPAMASMTKAAKLAAWSAAIIAK